MRRRQTETWSQRRFTGCTRRVCRLLIGETDQSFRTKHQPSQLPQPSLHIFGASRCGISQKCILQKQIGTRLPSAIEFDNVVLESLPVIPHCRVRIVKAILQENSAGTIQDNDSTQMRAHCPRRMRNGECGMADGDCETENGQILDTENRILRGRQNKHTDHQKWDNSGDTKTTSSRHCGEEGMGFLPR